MIELIDICKTYNKREVIRKFNLKIDKGDLISIIGKSGSGKTTLLNMIGLLEKQTTGDVLIKNTKNPSDKETLLLQRNFFAYIFQNYALIEEDTVEQNLNIALKYKKSKNRQYEIQNALKLVGLEGYNNKKVFELSGGEQQRVALARVILKPCDIILADEPTGNLDIKNRDMVFNILRKLNEEGKTIVIVTHDEYIANQCKKIIKI